MLHLLYAILLLSLCPLCPPPAHFCIKYCPFWLCCTVFIGSESAFFKWGGWGRKSFSLFLFLILWKGKMGKHYCCVMLVYEESRVASFWMHRPRKCACSSASLFSLRMNKSFEWLIEWFKKIAKKQQLLKE